MGRMVWMAIVAGGLLPSWTVAQWDSPESLVEALRNEDLEERREAWEAASGLGAGGVLPVAALLADEDPGVARAAGLALEAIVTRAAESDRGAVSQALMEAIGTELPEPARAQLLEYLSWVAGEEAVGPLLGWIDGSTLGLRALMTLCRIPGIAARDALAGLVDDPDETVAVAAVWALGDRPERGTEARLLRIARTAEGPRRVAALRALGGVGTAEALGLFLEVAPAGSEEERWAAVDSALRIAYRLEGRGDRATAQEVYWTILAPPVPVAVDEAQRYAALTGLTRVGGAEDVPRVLRSLRDADPIALTTALRFAEEQLGEDTLDVLVSTAQEAPGQQAAITWMVSQVKAGDPVPYLVSALRSGDAEVAAAAARGLSARPDARAWEALHALAEDGPVEAREAALGAILSILEGGEGEAPGDPAESYELVLRRCASPEVANRALTGLARHASPQHLELVEPYTRNEATRSAALRAYVAIGIALVNAGEEDRAREVLTSAVRLGAPRDSANAAIEALRRLGVEADFAAEAGFLTAWRVVGPFNTSQEPSWDHAVEGVLEARGREPVRGLEWQRVDTGDIQGIVNLLPLMTPNQNVAAYAYAEFRVEAAQDAVLGIGSDDGVAVWLNGEVVHRNNAARPIRVDEDKAPVSLVEGTNWVLLKVTQGGGDWGFTVRVMDAEGRPVRIEMTTP